jgi:hypothetical protein
MRAHGREGRQKSMRAGKFLAMLAIAGLAIGAFGAVALAAKKKKTQVIFTIPPGLNKFGKVNAKGSLNTVSACKPNRSMRLQVLDANGVVLATRDSATSDSSGNWSLTQQKGLPTGTTFVRVKAKKLTVGKFVCQAGFSPNVAILAA